MFCLSFFYLSSEGNVDNHYDIFTAVRRRTQELHHCGKSMHLLNLNGLHLYSGKVKIHVNPLLYAHDQYQLAL